MTCIKTWQSRLPLVAFLMLAAFPDNSFAVSESRTFFAGKIYKNHIGLCGLAGTGCGKSAASHWCRQEGYDDAMSFSTSRNQDQANRELLVNAGALCAHDTCNGFTFVKCYRKIQP